MMKQMIIFVASMLLTGMAIAQTNADNNKAIKKKKENREFKNSIIFYGTDYYANGYEFRNIRTPLIWQSAQLGIYIQRKIYKDYFVRFGYGQFKATIYLLNPKNHTPPRGL